MRDNSAFKPWGVLLFAVILFVCLAFFAHSLFAAQLRVTGTTPSLNNSGTCEEPVLEPMNVRFVDRIVFSWWEFGADSINAERDSIPAAPGSAFLWTKNVPAGTYRVRAYPANPDTAGCDTTITLQVPKDKPDKVRDARKP